MNSSIVYVYLGIVMIIVLATTFYVRTIKTKLDTKVDAMFQLVQSLVNEVNQLKSSQFASSKPKEVIELDINSSNNKIVVTENQESGDEESDDEESDDEESDDEESGDEESGDEESGDEESVDEDLFKKTVHIINESPHQVNMHSEVSQAVSQDIQDVKVQEVSVDLHEVSVDLPEVSVDLPEVSVDLPEVSVDLPVVSVDLPEVDVEEVEIKAVQLESDEINYEKLTVKDLKEMVTKKGGKVTGKKKGELIEFLLS